MKNPFNSMASTIIGLYLFAVIAAVTGIDPIMLISYILIIMLTVYLVVLLYAMNKHGDLNGFKKWLQTYWHNIRKNLFTKE